MIKFTVSLVVFFIALNGHSQEFVTSSEYVAKGVDRKTVDDFMAYDNLDEPIFGTIVLASDTSEVLLTFAITAPEYDSTYVMELVNPGLKNVKKILLVQVEYAVSCYDVKANYYIITKKDKLIELDPIAYTMCDWPCDIQEYRFPSQKYGVKNQIISTELYHDYQGNIDSTKTINMVNWNGKKINP